MGSIVGTFRGKHVSVIADSHFLNDSHILTGNARVVNGDSVDSHLAHMEVAECIGEPL